jgi:hypothetical protein
MSIGAGAEFGTCHMCKVKADETGTQPEARAIKFCPLCKHWFCKACRGNFFGRGLEAVKQLVGGRRDGCCGPLGEEQAAA